jgi:nucleotide-binding universal stress UspA family protein
MHDGAELTSKSALAHLGLGFGERMLKRILLLLGGTPSSVVARAYAFHLARETYADLAGLAGVDLTYIEAPMPGGIGVVAYKNRLEHRLKQQAIETRERLHQAYEQDCKSHSVPFEWLSFDGDPIPALQSAGEIRDIVITGHDTAFYGDIHEQLSETLAKLLRITPRPIIVCGDEAITSQDILIAYDGSVSAMRAVQMFALLGLAREQHVYVTSIAGDKELTVRRVGAAASYLRSYGLNIEEAPIASRMQPAEVLRIEVADRKIGMLVMGAYAHRGFREALFGSTTNKLTKNPPCALFVYH